MNGIESNLLLAHDNRWQLQKNKKLCFKSSFLNRGSEVGKKHILIWLLEFIREQI